MPACSQGVDTWVFYLSEIRTWLNASGVARLYLPSNELIDSVCCYCNFVYLYAHQTAILGVCVSPARTLAALLLKCLILISVLMRFIMTMTRLV